MEKNKKELMCKYLRTYGDAVMIGMSISMMMAAQEMSITRLAKVQAAYRDLEIFRKKLIKIRLKDPFLERLYAMKGLVV